VTCTVRTGWRLRLRGLWTRIWYGGPCSLPCARCGRPTSYFLAYCQDYADEVLADLIPPPG